MRVKNSRFVNLLFFLTLLFFTSNVFANNITLNESNLSEEFEFLEKYSLISYSINNNLTQTFLLFNTTYYEINISTNNSINNSFKIEEYYYYSLNEYNYTNFISLNISNISNESLIYNGTFLNENNLTIFNLVRNISNNSIIENNFSLEFSNYENLSFESYYSMFKSVRNKYNVRSKKEFQVRVDVPDNVFSLNESEINKKLKNRFRTKIDFEETFPIKEITFNNLLIENDTIDLGVEELTPNNFTSSVVNELNRAGYDSKKISTSFAIDPTRLNFTNATISLQAKGNGLLKCELWNFTQQRCDGEIIKIMDLRPGEYYNITLIPKDPAFFEFIENSNNDATAQDGSLELNTVITFGNVGGNIYDAYFRFQNISVPQGYTINNAYLNLTSTSSQNGNDVNTNVFGLREVNCAHFNTTTGGDDPTNNQRTGNFTIWDGIANWTNLENSENTRSPNISNIIQEIVNLGSWSSGNSICIVIEDDVSSSNAFREVSTVGEGEAQLYLDYSAPSVGENQSLDNSLEQVIQVYDLTLGQNGDPAGSQIAITFDSQTMISESFDHSTSSNQEVVEILEEGTYKVSYSCTWLSTGAANRHQMDNWLRENGTTEIVPSRTTCYGRDTETDRNKCSNFGSIIKSFSASSTVELMGDKQSGGASGSTLTTNDCHVFAQKLVSDSAHYYDSTGGQDFDSAEVTVNLDSALYEDSTNYALSSDRINVSSDGNYLVSYQVCAEQTSGTGNNRNIPRSFLRLNGVTDLNASSSLTYIRIANDGAGDEGCNSATTIVQMSSGDYIELITDQYANEASDSIATKQNWNWVNIVKIPTDNGLYFENAGGQTILEDATDPITFDTNQIVATGVSHSPSASEITFDEDGKYKVSYNFGWADDGGGDRVISCANFRFNGGGIIRPSESCEYSRGRTNNDNIVHNSITNEIILDVNASDYIELEVTPTGSAITVEPATSWVSVVKVDEGLAASLIVTSLSDIFLASNDTFEFNVTVSCVGSSVSLCGNVSSTLEYNITSSTFDTVPTSTTTPTWSLSSNPQYCLLDGGDSCNITWVVNMSGASDTNYKFRVNASNDIFFPNIFSDNVSVSIVSGSVVGFNESFYNFTSTKRDSGELTREFLVTSYVGSNNNVEVSCESGDCGVFVDDFNDGVNLTEGEFIEFNITCSDSSVGNFDAVYNVSSNQYDGAQRLNVSCSVTENFGLLYGFLNSPPSLTSVVQNNTLTINASIFCGGDVGSVCGDVDIFSIYYASSNWYNESFQYRKEITLSYSGSTTLTDFPLYVNISKEDDMKSDYGDLRFINGTCSSGSTTELDYEIEYYDSNNAHVWVKLPQVTGSSVNLCMYYGNSTVTTTQSASNVWKSNYGLVYHMDSVGIDSTSNGLNKVADVGTPTSDNSYLGYGIVFSNLNAWDLANIAYWENAWAERSHEVVFKTSSDITSRQTILAEGGGTNGIMMYILNGYLYARWWSESTGWTGGQVNASINTSSIYHVVMSNTFPGNSQLFLNGNNVGSITTVATMSGHTGDGGVGYTGGTGKDYHDLANNQGNYFDGTIYELRAYDTEESDDWINLSYMTMLRNLEVVSYSLPESKLQPVNISGVPSTSPMWTLDSQPQTCNLNYSQTCSFEWDVNIIGPVGNFYEIGALFYSDYSEIFQNTTPTSQLEIVGDAQILWEANSLNLSTYLDNGNATGSESITAVYAQNTGISVNCVSGDCSVITDSFTNGITLNRDESSSVSFSCVDSTLGNYSALFNVSSNEASFESQINVSCNVIQPYGILEVMFLDPIGGANSFAVQNDSIYVIGNLYCGGLTSSLCGDISLFIQYSNTGNYLNISSSDSTPLWTNSSQLQSCSLNYSQSCNVSWYINATGTTGVTHNISIYVNSSYSNVTENRSDEIYLDIIEPVPLIRWNVSSFDFGVVYTLNGDVNVSIGLISINNNNTGVDISCVSGDCSVITNDWINGATVSVESGANVTFTCDDSTIGIYSATFNVTSSEDTEGSIIESSCIVEQAFGILNATLLNPMGGEINEIPQNKTFQLNATLSCGGISNSVCGEVSSYLMYNLNHSPFGNGRDGVLNVTTSNYIVNNYTYLTQNTTLGNIILSVNDSSAFSIGDEILIVQIQNGSGYGTAGNYEFKHIENIDGNEIYIDSNLENSYGYSNPNTTTSSLTQVIRVPNYVNVEIQSGGSITAPDWNGFIGGVVAIRVLDTLDMSGYINLSERGFRGGTCNACSNNDWGTQGEGTHGLGGDSLSANTNGGGGGYGPSGFGGEPAGGGGYGSVGEIGQSSDVFDSEGGEVIGTIDLSGIYFGGGGGAGGDNDDVTPFPEFESGGGIAIVYAGNILNARIHSLGENGAYPGGAGGASGAGAGGTIWLKTTNITINDLDARGGSGVVGNGADISGDGGDGRVRIDTDFISGTVNPSLGYNGEGPLGGLVWDFLGKVPFWTNDTQPQTCLIDVGESCNISWIVNVTGTLEEYYNLSVLSVSNYSEVKVNQTEQTIIYVKRLDDLFNIFYGFVNNDILLAQNSLPNFYDFGFNKGFNIFVYDSEASIDLNSLVPIGRNITNQVSSNDFSELDTLMGNGDNYTTNIELIYSTDGTNPRNTDSFIIYTQQINGVPIINSTNTSAFITGILWDSSDDSGNGEFDLTDREDIVFISKINESKQGAYEIVDYEISIPETLGLINITSSVVSFFIS